MEREREREKEKEDDSDKRWSEGAWHGKAWHHQRAKGKRLRVGRNVIRGGGVGARMALDRHPSIIQSDFDVTFCLPTQHKHKHNTTQHKPFSLSFIALLHKFINENFRL